LSISSTIIEVGAEFEFKINRTSTVDLPSFFPHPSTTALPSLPSLAPNHGLTAGAPPLSRGMWAQLLLAQWMDMGRRNKRGDPGSGRPMRCVGKTGHDESCGPSLPFTLPHWPLLTTPTARRREPSQRMDMPTTVMPSHQHLRR
jgi:hypothetical protein